MEVVPSNNKLRPDKAVTSTMDLEENPLNESWLTMISLSDNPNFEDGKGLVNPSLTR